MKQCIVVSDVPEFAGSVQECLRLVLEEWSLTVVHSWDSCCSLLYEDSCKIVLIDADPASGAGVPDSIEAVSSEFYDIWFLAAGQRKIQGALHMDTPLMPHSLSFFCQNSRRDHMEQPGVWNQRFLTAAYPILLNHMWNGLLNRWILSDHTMVTMAARNMHVPNLENMHLLPILVKTNHRSRTEATRAEASRDHLYFMNVFSELLLENEHAGAVLDRFSQKWAVILYTDLYSCTGAELEERCREVMEKADEADWNLSFFIGEAVIPEQLLGEWEQLDRLADSDVGYASQLVWLGDVSEKEPSDRPEFPTMQNWKLMLIQEKWDAVKNEISSSLYCLAEQGSIDVRWMSAFRDSFLQMVCEVMQVHGIPAPQILSTPLSGEEFERAASNLQIMTGWCGQILDRIAEFNTTEKADTVVKRAQKYILQNLDKELTRDSIANHVFVSGGYLGKLFKKEIGMNLPEYINSERMALAAKLLEQTELNITNIAMDVGFSNFPYFSTQFKRYSGLSPVEYRKQKHRSNT